MVGERFGPNKKEQMDMLGSFIRHGLTHEEAESESLMQMYDFPLISDLTVLNLCAVSPVLTPLRQHFVF